MNRHVDDYLARLHDRDLMDLRWHWGGAYEITWDGRFRARRRDDGGTLDTASAQELREQIRDNYDARPVPRDNQR